MTEIYYVTSMPIIYFIIFQVGAWLNNSNDPIGSNYKKNEQYWKAVAAFYNSTSPKNRARLPKQIKSQIVLVE